MIKEEYVSVEEWLEDNIDIICNFAELYDEHQKQAIKLDVKFAGFDANVIYAAIYRAFRNMNYSDQYATGILECRLKANDKDIKTGLAKITKAWNKVYSRIKNN